MRLEVLGRITCDCVKFSPQQIEIPTGGMYNNNAAIFKVEYTHVALRRDMANLLLGYLNLI